MKRPVRDPVKGTYTINGKEYNELFGSREQVWNGTAHKTKYGLTKQGLVMNKWGRIVSADKHESATKEKRLEKQFGAKFANYKSQVPYMLPSLSIKKQFNQKR